MRKLIVKTKIWKKCKSNYKYHNNEEENGLKKIYNLIKNLQMNAKYIFKKKSKKIFLNLIKN